MELNISNLPDRSIGRMLRSVREKNNISLDDASKATRIRGEYIEAIEDDNFSVFDSHVYAKGFIKNYAHFLGVESENLIALYRRDYENKSDRRGLKKSSEKRVVSVKKISNGVKINKRSILIVFGAISIFFISILLLTFIQNIFRQPYLKITSPLFGEGVEVLTISGDQKSIRIEGETEIGTLIKINEEPVKINPELTFQSDFIPLGSERNLILVEASNNLGVSTKRVIEYFRTDVGSVEVLKGDIIISVKEKPIFLLIRSDGIIKFNDIAVPNEVINITAENFIEIETSEPQYIKVQIDQEEFQLTKSFERFELGESVKRINN